jgi:hypothetical protein
MNKQLTNVPRKHILLNSLYCLLILEFLSAFALGVFFFSSTVLPAISHQLHLFSQLFEYVVASIIGTAFLICLLFPSEKRTTYDKLSSSPSSYRSTFSLQRPHYDPLTDTTNPASPSYSGRFNPRV